MPDSLSIPDLGVLPEWDLSDLYDGLDSPTLAADLERAKAEALALVDAYRGRLSALTAADLAQALSRYEALDQLLNRIVSYGYLVRAGDVSDAAIGRFYQTLTEKISDIETNILFFCLELNLIEDDTLKAQFADARVARYRPWIMCNRAFRAHQLDETSERLLSEKQVVGGNGWTRLFDETLAELRVAYRDRSLDLTEALNLTIDQDQAVRHDAAQGIGQALSAQARVLTLIFNMTIKDKEIEDRWRKYPRPFCAQNLSNQVEDKVVDALVSAVRDAYPRLSHRYYRLKARWFKQETLDWRDRNAPLPQVCERLIPFEQAQACVLSAYRAFSPELAELGQRFFDQGWIDAPARPGKAPGAFAHPTVASVHPYLLLNYQGKIRDVMTLAHELGHGLHQLLAGASQGHLLSQTPLTLAETASVFGEMLTFQALLKAETDPVRRRSMLASKVEDMLNTVIRQIAFHEFEEKLHAERRSGEIATERIGDLWLEVQQNSLGPALRLDDAFRPFWSYIGHFIHAPFYVYAYAFGDCLTNTLYALYRKEPQGFAERYLDLLRAGGSLHHRDLLAPFALDAADPAFWAQGLSVISGFIDQLEQDDPPALAG